jgi:hypothetical protein
VFAPSPLIGQWQAWAPSSTRNTGFEGVGAVLELDERGSLGADPARSLVTASRFLSGGAGIVALSLRTRLQTAERLLQPSRRDGTQMPLVCRHNAPGGARRHAGRPSFAERYDSGAPRAN